MRIQEAADPTDTPVDWAALATALPGPETLTALTNTTMTLLSPAHLLDAITCTERLQSHLAGVQTSLLTEFARPGRAGDITRIVNTLDRPRRRRPHHRRQPGSRPAAHPGDRPRPRHGRSRNRRRPEHLPHHRPAPRRKSHRPARRAPRDPPSPHRTDSSTAAAPPSSPNTPTSWTPRHRTQVENIVLPLAQSRTAGRLRPLIDRAVITADPGAADRRVKKARKTREVTHQPLKEQLSLIKAILPADGAVTVFTLIDLLAGKKTHRRRPDHRRTPRRRTHRPLHTNYSPTATSTSAACSTPTDTDNHRQRPQTTVTTSTPRRPTHQRRPRRARRPIRQPQRTRHQQRRLVRRSRRHPHASPAQPTPTPQPTDTRAGR